jgi:hypothetical protein
MYTLVSPLFVEAHWPRVEHWIARAIDKPDPAEDLAIIKHKMLQSVAQLWIGQKPMTWEIDLVLVTEGMILEDIPTLVLRWCTAENLEDKVFDLGLVELWAFKQGYRRLQVWGRRGWERKLRALGFTHSFSVMDKFIEQGLH